MKLKTGPLLLKTKALFHHGDPAKLSEHLDLNQSHLQLSSINLKSFFLNSQVQTEAKFPIRVSLRTEPESSAVPGADYNTCLMRWRIADLQRGAVTQSPPPSPRLAVAGGSNHRIRGTLLTA